jgi:hypothetical protein
MAVLVVRQDQVEVEDTLETLVMMRPPVVVAQVAYTAVVVAAVE